MRAGRGKQRHTSKRIFERLRDEHGYAGGITIVKDYVLARRLRQLEVFVPLRLVKPETTQAWSRNRSRAAPIAPGLPDRRRE
jgi:hypothetical protein